MSETPRPGDPLAADVTKRRLLLFLAGNEVHSTLAQRNLMALCGEYPECEFEIETVNVLEDIQLALEHRVLVTPCLLLIDPPPRVAIAGTLSDFGKVRTALRFHPK